MRNALRNLSAKGSIDYLYHESKLNISSNMPYVGQTRIERVAETQGLSSQAKCSTNIIFLRLCKKILSSMHKRKQTKIKINDKPEAGKNERNGAQKE